MLIIIAITLYIVRLIRITKKKKHTNGIRALNQTLLRSQHSKPNIHDHDITETQVVKTNLKNPRYKGTPHSNCSYGSNTMEENERCELQPASKKRSVFQFPVINVSAYAKLYIIVGSFCTLWLPFCILWPVKSVSPNLIPEVVYTTSYWLGYAQSLFNPILLLILNQNYRLRARHSIS
jgi:hypothetical protein